MRISLCTLVASAMLLAVPASPAQDAAIAIAPTVSVVPHLIKFAGALPGVSSKAEAFEVKFSLYPAQTGGEALWSETQQVSLDPAGKYSVLLGSVVALADSVFAQGQARWIGVTMGAEQEFPRTILVATPYSLKAGDSETLGGHPVSDFTLKNALPASGTNITQINVGSGLTGGGTGPTVTLGLSSSYLETLGNDIYPQITGTNTMTGKNTFSSGKLFVGSSPVLGTSNIIAGSEIVLSTSGANVTVGVNGPSLLKLANGYYPQLTANNSFSGTNTFSKAITFASGQTFPGTVSLSANNTFSGSDTFSKPITFASGQTFPGAGSGTITGITTSSPLSGSGTSGSVALSLNTSALETTLNSVYAGLSANNTFSGSETFTKLITFASGQTFPGIPTLSGTDAFTGSVSMSGASTTGSELTVTNSESTANAGHAISAVMSGGAGDALFAQGGYGIYGQTNASATFGASPVGVYGAVPSGYVNNTGASAAGIWGHNAVSGEGVYGDSVDGFGVAGLTTDTTSAGIVGNATNTASTGYGVLGVTYSDSGYGIYGVGVSPSTEGTSLPDFKWGAAIWADTNVSSSAGNVGALAATADDSFSAWMLNDSPASPTLYLENDGGGSTTAVPLMIAVSPKGACSISGAGDVTCSGQIKTAAPVAGSSQQLEVYSVQSSENWFEDFGSGQLFNGHATVAIDPAFASIVNTGVEYHVFLTPEGNCKGLFVTSKGANGFEVRELGDGGSSVEFDYRIVAKRTGHESERLTDATSEMRQMTQTRNQIMTKRASIPRTARRLPPAPRQLTPRPLSSRVLATTINRK